MRYWQNLKVGDKVTFRGTDWQTKLHCVVTNVGTSGAVAKEPMTNALFWIDDDSMHTVTRDWA